MPFSSLPPSLPSKKIVKSVSKLRQTPYAGKDYSSSNPSYTAGNSFLKSNQRSLVGQKENLKTSLSKGLPEKPPKPVGGAGPQSKVFNMPSKKI